MPPNVVTMVMVVVLAVWAGFIAASLIQHQPLPAAVWTVPGATAALLKGSWKLKKDDDTNKET